MKKLINWFKESNRWKHLIGGILVYIILLAMVFMKIPVFLTLAAAVLFVMASLEFKDRAWGGKWDWFDIIAGTIVPLIIGIILCLTI